MKETLVVVLRVTILALEFFSVVPVIHATDPPELTPNGNATGEPFTPDEAGRISLPLQITKSQNLSFGAVTHLPNGEPSASELNEKLTNPVSDLWSIGNQFNNFELNNGHWNNNWNFQPVLPVGLTKDWNLITRPVMPF